MNIRLTSAALASAFAASCATPPPNQLPVPIQSAVAPTTIPRVSGSWLLTVSTALGVYSERKHIAQAGTKITGNTASGTGFSTFYGSIEDSTISWTTGVDEKGERRPKTIPTEFNGIVSGEVMRGDAELGLFGKGTWTATRIR